MPRDSNALHPPILVEDHPLLRVRCFTAAFPEPLGVLRSPGWLADRLRIDPDAELSAPPEVRTAIRDMLRHGGYRPAGRGKRASEFLVRAAADGALGSINVAVDICNVISLHSGFPISVIDLGLVTPPLRIAIPPPGSRYIFNAGGQEIDLTGLVCLIDADGPCANAVRDSQRTKTRPETTETLSIVWGAAGYEDALAKTVDAYQDLLRRAGATVSPAR